MANVEAEGDDVIDQIDWESLLDFSVEDLDLFLDDNGPLANPSSDNSSGEAGNCNPSPDPLSSSLGEVEQLLMEDDYTATEANHGFSDTFFSDILVDASADCEARASGDETSNPETNVSNDSHEKDKGDSSEENNGEDRDDPIIKKRKRQLRNRDAAVRSRERRKMYVRDLEMKSKYLEGECRRLERLLQCCFAENQALHLHLQKDKAFGAYTTKQESAVLLLESLLLGSLLWFLCIMCQSSLNGLLLPTLAAYQPGNVGNKDQEIVALRGAGNERQGLRVVPFFLNKRCKASRTKMKLNCFLAPPVLA